MTRTQMRSVGFSNRAARRKLTPKGLASFRARYRPEIIDRTR